MGIKVLMQKSDQGEVSLYDRRDKFIASYKNGKWTKALLFDSYELEEFSLIEDEQEIEAVLSEARAALGCPLEHA